MNSPRRTSTRSISFRSFASKGPLGVTVAKMMIAWNDMSLANESLQLWKSRGNEVEPDRSRGAGLYFTRIQIAHLFEAIAIIEGIVADESLRTLVDQCDCRTKKSFEKLSEYIPRGAKRADLVNMVEKVRHGVVFHYNSDKLISRAIDENSDKEREASIRRGSEAFLWHFAAGDAVVHDMVVRQIWKLPNDASQEDVDNVVTKIHDIFLLYFDFAGEFIWKFSGRS